MTRAETMSAASGGGSSGLGGMLRALASDPGSPAEFWTRFAQTAQRLARARAAVVHARRVGDGASAPWQAIAVAPLGTAPPDMSAVLLPHLHAAMLRDGFAETGAGSADRGLLVPVQIASAGQELVLQILDPADLRDRATLVTALGGLCAVPLAVEAGRSTRRATRDAARLAETLSLVARVQDAETFDAAALAWVNGLAELFACESATLVWRAREGMRLRAISHGERVERRTEASALAEQAAEEALAQGVEVIWPMLGGADATVAHAHGQYAALVHPGYMITLPMVAERADGREYPLGAVLLERRRAPFTAAEQWALRLHCEMAQAPLARLHADSRWLPVRLGRAIAPSIPRPLKPRGLRGRALLVLAVLALAGLALLPVPFRLTATAVVKTDAMAYVSAPFDGFIAESGRLLGDVVSQGDLLFQLDRTELDLERNTLLAELAQANREAEIRRASGELSMMLIAEARAEEITTRLLQIDLRLASAAARAPIAGIVVEGEPAMMIGEPVRRGEALVTLAALSALFVEAAVSERDLAFVEPGLPTQVTLLARPNEGIDLSVRGVIPAAAVQDGDNVFPVRLSSPEDAPDWWLPGMTGVAKIDAGRRPLGWVATRRLVDWLRLALWI